MVVLLYLSGQAFGSWDGRCGNMSANNRMTGGDIADRGKWPWMVKLHTCKDTFKPETCNFTCGGSLISDRYILTAAHCVQTGQLMTATFGDYDSVADESTKITAQIEMNFNHHEYDIRHNFLNDIALLRIKTPLDLNDEHKRFEPICLPRPDLPTHLGEKCVLTGWGQTESKKLSSVLRQIDLPITYDYRCEEKFPCHYNRDTKFCTENLHGIKSACFGDSGGPLTCQLGNNGWVVRGVAAHIDKLDCTGNINAFTRVAPYTEWIAGVTGQRLSLV
ncbi:unnamed protein product [Medioppia subpectinata]|uniref:Peptidase S1 domain-containing protein n=1 Tax=Medioppia subpectinata TaxID=1979941 RepID=A0A7R9KDW1_9ACAR|nr:unnamed protein product [Medioppia subpectinata]CAG2101740.1 unnamed protein product [Medioppia subpectinata]